MTSTSLERIVRSSLAAILNGTGALEVRIDEVVKKLEALPSPDRKCVAKLLKLRLTRALRQKKATIVSANELAAPIKEKLEQTATQRDATLIETRQDKTLMAGFTLQLGDDRMNYDLFHRLHSLQ